MHFSIITLPLPGNSWCWGSLPASQWEAGVSDSCQNTTGSTRTWTLNSAYDIEFETRSADVANTHYVFDIQFVYYLYW